MSENVISAAESFVFWDDRGKIIPNRLYEFFFKHGIGKYYPDPQSTKNAQPIVVKVTGSLVSEVSVNYLLEFTRDYIVNLSVEPGKTGEILDSLHTSTSLFGDKNLKLLTTLNLEFISDEPEKAFLFFLNGVLEVTGSHVNVKAYSEFDQYVWESSIIQHEFSPVEDSAPGDFKRFLIDLSNHDDSERAGSRLQSLQSAVGYLLHRYKNPATTKAIILMDSYVNGQPNGGSGKTLLINAIGNIRKLAIIDGKMYDQKEWFAFSSVGIDCEVLLFDDVDADFDFEKIFPLMTTGMQIRRKYRDHVYLPFKRSPKVTLTTNYAILGDSASHRRRKFEFEVTATYSADYSPRDKFERNFFSEWLEVEWNLFFNTMIECLRIFLNDGLMESEPLNLNLAKLIGKTSEDFTEWAVDTIQLDVRYDKRSLYTAFIREYPENNRLKPRDLTYWLRAYGSYLNCQVRESHSDSTRYIWFEGISEK